jgi:hypothetical protein
MLGPRESGEPERIHIISTALIAAASDANDNEIDNNAKDLKLRTELDSHANMVVVGNNCLIAITCAMART